MSWMCSQRGSFDSTATSLSPPPASSLIFSTATGRTFTTTPGELRGAAGLSAHLQHGHGAHVHDDARVAGVVQQHEHVLRIAVLTERVVEVAVVGRVAEGRVQHAVQVDATGLVVDLVLHAAAARDLD